MSDQLVSPKVRSRLGLPADGPGSFSFADVSSWVIWQFPLKRRGWWCGAAHPPLRAFGWFPILINSREEKIEVHPGPVFPTPEDAAGWIAAAS